jgi:hypothetical protein
MPVLALQLKTGGSEADFGRLRFSLGAGHPVNQSFHGPCSIYYGRFANASGRPSIVPPPTKGFASCLGRSSNLFTEIVTVMRQRPIIGKRWLINEKDKLYQRFDKMIKF